MELADHWHLAAVEALAGRKQLRYYNFFDTAGGTDDGVALQMGHAHLICSSFQVSVLVLFCGVTWTGPWL